MAQKASPRSPSHVTHGFSSPSNLGMNSPFGSSRLMSPNLAREQAAQHGGQEADGSPTPTTTKLNVLAERFSVFCSDLESESKTKRDAESSRWQTIQDNLVKMEKNLNSEIKRRMEADKALQAMFESQVSNVQEKLISDFSNRSNSLASSIEGLTQRVQSMEKMIIEEKEGRVKEIEEASGVLLKQLNEFQSAFEMEKVLRLEREAQILKRVGDDVFRLQEKLDTEKIARESVVTQLRDEFEENNRVRNKNDEKFQTFMLEEIAGLKNGLVSEKQTRETAEEEIVQALNHYTNTLQQGLRSIVNK